MTPLNVVDLDGTLLRTDSFRRLVLSRLDLGLLRLLARRVAGRLDPAAFVEAVARQLAPLLADTAAMERFAARLLPRVDPAVLALLRAEAGGGAVTLVLSASPDAYVTPLARRLGFQGLGSHWQQGRFVHCHGEEKRRVLRERFPPTAFFYAFGLGDADADRGWLALFERGGLYRRSLWTSRTVPVPRA